MEGDDAAGLSTVLHKHGDPIECHAVYLHRTVAQIMAIGVKSVNDGTIQACVVVPRHENLMGIGNHGRATSSDFIAVMRS